MRATRFLFSLKVMVYVTSFTPVAIYEYTLDAILCEKRVVAAPLEAPTFPKCHILVESQKGIRAFEGLDFCWPQPYEVTDNETGETAGGGSSPLIETQTE